MPDASHFHWRIPGITPGDPAYAFGPSPLGDHNAYTDPVYPDQLSITDPGQIGQGNLPDIHGPSSDNQFTVVDPRRTPEMPLVATLPDFGFRNIYRRIRGSTWNPYLFRNQEEEVITDVAPAAHGANPWGPAGSPRNAQVTEEHGPVTYDELTELGHIRQPMPTAKRQWLRRLLLLPPKHLDDSGAFDERTIPAVGVIQPKDNERQDSPAAAGFGNQFVIPDIRRTFDQPRDAPPGTPLDEFGHPIVDKAGYPLMATTLEPIKWYIRTDHAYPVEVDYAPVSPDRVRAGVANPTGVTIQGELEARPQRMPHWFYFRPFDKLMADHPFGTKGMSAQPSISRPTMSNQELSTQVASGAGGPRFFAPAPGMEAAGLIPNSDRQVPAPWDSQIYVDNSTETPTAQRRNWRIG